MVNIGTFALILVFGMALFGMAAALGGRWTAHPALQASATRAVAAKWASVTVAIALLWVLFSSWLTLVHSR